MARSVYPAPGTPRPVQRGSFNLPSGSNLSVDVTVNPIDPLKAKLSVNGWYANGVQMFTATGDTVLVWEIINSTTIRFSRFTAGGGSTNLQGKWELESWY